LEELMSVADRIAVMFEGRVIGVLPADQADRETLGLMMAGIEVAEARAPGDRVGAGG
jgi:simple sugar transport system ATP-binding protein